MATRIEFTQTHYRLSKGLNLDHFPDDINRSILMLKKYTLSIIDKYRNAKFNDQKIIGNERMEIITSVEQTIKLNILFIYILLRDTRSQVSFNDNKAQIISLKNRRGQSYISLQFFHSRYYLSGYIKNLKPGVDFLSFITRELNEFRKSTDLTRDILEDNYITNDEFARISTQILKRIYNLVSLIHAVETMSINQ